MIEIGKWYRFRTDSDKALFLDYAASLGAYQTERSIDDEWCPPEIMNAECLMIKINNGYHMNYRTKFNPDYMDAKYLTNEEREFILNELYCKGDNKMVECYKETATVRSIMEREYHKEMRELELRRDALIDEAYLESEIGKQAQVLALLINANTLLKVDFKSYLDIGIMPLNIQREIEQIKENFSKEADKLAIKYQNLEAMLSICETYEQKEKLLKKNHIIK